MRRYGTNGPTLPRLLSLGVALPMGRDNMENKAAESLKQRLSKVDAVIQNQDNREHDLLDSDDYYQFEGGLAGQC